MTKYALTIPKYIPKLTIKTGKCLLEISFLESFLLHREGEAGQRHSEGKKNLFMAGKGDSENSKMAI